MFCGLCGFNLQVSALASPPLSSTVRAAAISASTHDRPIAATLGLHSRFAPTAGPATIGSTQLQTSSAKLFHVQTEQLLELAPNLTVIHIGKPNDRIPPDIDLAGYPNSEIVSRIHADIRVEGDAYYIEDVGSSNGTYINNAPLAVGSRHRLRPGDRIAFGKGDKVSFLFQT
jgi:pSer/pThr/pTyr-binding forkhead associated (FHA) protein